MVSEKVLLKISDMKDVMRFRKKGKPNPWFIGPFKVLQRIGKVICELFLPTGLSFHLMFYVSML